MVQYKDYGTVVSPWIVVHLLPKMQRVVKGRFHRASDAEGHAMVLRRLIPGSTFIVVFDPPSPKTFSNQISSI